MNQLVQLETPIRGLHASAPEPLPFAPSLHIRAFRLERELGNVLLYSVSELGSEATAIAYLGGISRQYLNHRHEARFASPLSAPLFVHENERESVARRLDVRGSQQRPDLLRGRERAGQEAAYRRDPRPSPPRGGPLIDVK